MIRQPNGGQNSGLFENPSWPFKYLTSPSFRSPLYNYFFSKDGCDPDPGMVEFNLDNLEDDSQNYEPPPQPSAK